jgi:hypothetical protein
VNDNFPRIISLNNSGLGCFLTLLLLALLLGSVGLGWVVNGVLIFLALLLLLPALAFWGFRWWLGRNLVDSQCPACNYQFTGFNGTECRCPNCEEALKVEGGRFSRLTPPGTIDVEAVEVPASRLED